MVDTPQVTGPDGVLRAKTIFSTTASERFFEGTMDASTVDMQVSIRGGAFSSSPDLIVFGQDTFTIPNPAAFPDGLELVDGLNTLQIRSISLSGAVSDSAEVEVTLVQEADIGLIGQAPTNISIERFENDVVIRAEGINDSRFRGMNYYASRFQGGGTTGYQRVNLNIVADFQTVQETVNLRTLQIQSSIVKNPDGTPAADPLYVKLRETQTSSNDVIQNLEDLTLTEEQAAAITLQEQSNLLKTDFVDVFEVPETINRIQTNVTIDSIVDRNFYTFRHNRLFGPANDPPTIPIAEFQATPTTQPLYYVVAAVYYDPDNRTEVISAFSTEVYGQPVTVDADVGSFPAPSRLDIAQEVITSLNRTTPQLGVAPGNVIRDTFVDPFSQEATRMRFLVDFLYRIQSFDTLIDIDGVQSGGTPVPVVNSPYKTALQRVLDLNSTRDTQIVIDNAFDQLAARNNVFRRAGTRSQGFVTFFTQATPTATIFIPVGTRVNSGAVAYVTTQDASIPLNNTSAFYNPTTRRFEIDVSIIAENTGSAGNLAPGQIRTVSSNLPGLSVTNRNATFGGRNQETNFELATRARESFAAVDSGTERGIRQIAADIPGVESVLVVSAGDDLMQRDFDDDYNKHVGGKVDVWLQGDNLGRFTDTFAFTFETARDVRFVPAGNPNQLLFRALDPALSQENPIAGFLEDDALGLGLRNASSGTFFNLEGVTFPSWDLVQLSDTNQPVVTDGDIILGDYRYVTSTKFTFTRQPVETVISVTGATSGVLPNENWQIVSLADPLLEGRSTKAGEQLEIIQIDGFPSATFTEVTSEEHLMLGEFEEFLDNIGSNPLTVRVFNQGRTIEYRGPNDPSGVSDYVITPGNETTALSIRRTENSLILSGETVLVDYSHAENFTVEYEVEQVVTTTQEAIDQSSHLTADILVKESLRVPVDITATIATVPGARISALDTQLRTNIATLLTVLPQGSALRQSDVIAILDNTSGVSFVQTPLTKMARAADTQVVREPISSAGSDVVFLVGNATEVDADPLFTSTVSTWLLEDQLEAATTDGGGPDNTFRAVYQDDKPLELITTSIEDLKNRAGQAFIIGVGGASIPGYSDDATIQTNFPEATTEAEIQLIREQLTANRIVVSTAADDRPPLHSYTATYITTSVDAAVGDIELGSLEFFDVGDIIFTFAEDSRG